MYRLLVSLLIAVMPTFLYAEKTPTSDVVQAHLMSISQVEKIVEQSFNSNIPAPPSHLGNDNRMCLAQAIYHEARGESLRGQMAVASVILNRTKADRWSKSVCGNIKWDHAFSFVDINTHSVPPVHEHDAWAVAWILAGILTEPLKELEYADHYHTTNVKPSWRHSMILVGRIGDHLFYRDPVTPYRDDPAS